jgi:hypothetical protein
LATDVTLPNLHCITAYGHSYIRDTPIDRNECDQWTLVRDGDDQEDFVIQEHIVFGALYPENHTHA